MNALDSEKYLTSFMEREWGEKHSRLMATLSTAKWRMLGGNSGPVVVIHDERLRTNWALKQGPNVEVPTSELQFSWE